MGEERAQTDDLAGALARVLPALDAFLRFTGPDGATQRERWRAALDEPLPADGLGAEAVLDRIASVVVPHGLRLGSPGFSGWVATMPTVVPTVASLAGAIAANQRWWASPGNFLEQLGARWLGALLGISGHTGAFASGGAVANLIALGAARQQAGEARGVDPAASGVSGLPRPRVYAHAGVHHVIARALSTLGLGRDALCIIPAIRPRRAAGGLGAIDLGALARAIDDDIAAGSTPVAVVASAGDASTGAIDAIDAMRAIAHARGVWLHVDGAYGGFGVLDSRVRDRFGDLAAVDSFVVDPHKWLAVPVGCGAVFVKDGARLARAFALDAAEYMPYTRRDGELGSPFDSLGEGSPAHGLDHSAPARGLWVWAALAEIGARGMADRVARHLDCARRVAERVRATPELELLAEPVLSVCCFRYRPRTIRDQGTLERLNRAVLLAVRARGRSVPSSTRVANKLAIRACFIGPNQTLADADALVDEVLAAGLAARATL